MKIAAQFFNRDFNEVSPPTKPKVGRYSWRARWGPDAAQVTVENADELLLWPLLDWLGYSVRLPDEDGEDVWWGYVNQVIVQVGAIERGVSLENMANAIRVAYVRNRKSYLTDWATNEDSITAYGRKELLLSRAGSTVEEVLQYRDTQLARRGIPVVVTRKVQGRGIEKPRVTFHCKGWGHRLGWRTYSQTAGEEHQRRTEDKTQEFGWSDYMEKVAQSFQVEGIWPWRAERIAVRLMYDHDDDVDQPTDDVMVELRSDSGNNPGALLASGTVARSDILPSTNWNTITLDTIVTLQPSTRYWIVVRRAGVLDGDTYYRVGVHEDEPYDRGQFVIYDPDDMVWRSRSEYQFIDEQAGLPGEEWRGNADMSFQVLGTVETAAAAGQGSQVEMIYYAVAQSYLGGIEVETSSGVYTNPRRDGTSTALEELESLLETGNSSDGRLLATIRSDRSLYIYDEAAQGDIKAYLRTSDGALVDAFNEPIPVHTCPVAIWAKALDDLGPVERGLTGGDLPFFIETSAYDPTKRAEEAWTFEQRDVESVWDAPFGVREG